MKFTLSQASRGALSGLVLAGSLALAAPAAAQSVDEARLRKIEAEVRALQRTVFPNGDGRFFTPEVITPNGASPANSAVGTPSETAVTDILARLDALETQLQRLTARSEENANRIGELQARVDAMTPPAGTAQPAAGTTQPATGTLVAAQPGIFLVRRGGCSRPGAGTGGDTGCIGTLGRAARRGQGDRKARHRRSRRRRIRLWLPPVGRQVLSRGAAAAAAVRRQVSEPSAHQLRPQSARPRLSRRRPAAHRGDVLLQELHRAPRRRARGRQPAVPRRVA